MNNTTTTSSESSISDSSGKKVSVYILTGFLGAGKTTALNSLLQQYKNDLNFIIENEIGQVNIDKNLVAGNFEKVFEITNGCLCCNLDTDLYDALDQISRLESKPDNLFIETTGIADAGNLSAIFREDFVAEVFDLRKIICIVDAEVIEDFLGKTAEAARQIVASDLIVLNKAGNISTDYLSVVKKIVSRINPFAPVAETINGSLDASELNKPNPSRPLFSLDIATPKTESHDITSVLYESESYFDVQKVELLLRTSLYIYYQDIYRIKGYLRNQHGEVFLMQSAGKTLSVTKTSEQIEKSYLVFIGRKLTHEIADRLLKPAIVKI